MQFIPLYKSYVYKVEFEISPSGQGVYPALQGPVSFSQCATNI